MNVQAHAYIELNAAYGHSPFCGIAGGADCSCARGTVSIFVVTCKSWDGASSVLLGAFDTSNDAGRFARWIAQERPGVRVRRVTGHVSDPESLDRLVAIEALVEETEARELDA